MKKLEPLSPDLETLLEPHRVLLPLSRAQKNRALSRAARTTTIPEVSRPQAHGQPRLILAAAAVAVVAAAYAGRPWLATVGARQPTSPTPPSTPIATTRIPACRPPIVTAPAAPKRAAGTELRSSPVVVHKRNAPYRAKYAPAPPTRGELQLLLSARRAAGGEDFSGALALLTEHARWFRNGALVEEREALRVRSLVGLGRYEDARRAASDFHVRFPQSVLLDTLGRWTENER